MNEINRVTLSILCSVLAFLTIPQAQGDDVSSALKNDAARCEEFMDWGMGMFIHWSLDSELGSVISHSMVGASDDYLDRYINELPKYFDPKSYDAEEWVKLAKLAGFKYMVLTTKHHSGFCLWPTKTTEFSVANTPYKKDIVKQYVKACRKYDMKVGFYFSPEDFLFLHKQGHEIRRRSGHANVSSNPELLAHNKAQIKELFSNYGPIDIAFLDAFDNKLIGQYIHQLQPKCIITRGEMKTPEQKIPDKPMKGPWESCFTLGTQWQFKPTNEEYKSGAKLIEMLIDIRSKGGNLLINMGPEPSGKIPMEQERRFRELALWMFINGEGIHDIRPCPVIKEGELRFTRAAKDSSTVYVFIPQGDTPWKKGTRREYTLESLAATDKVRISVLGQNDRVVEYNPKAKPVSKVSQTAQGLRISVVRAQRIYNNSKWPNPVVVKLEGVEFASEVKQAETIDDETVKRWSQPYRNWHYYPDHVIPAKPNIRGFEDVLKTDVPTVFQLPGDKKWYMTFIGFDGKGYQSFVAQSDDLVHWSNMRLAMGYGPKDSFDYGGVVLGAFLYKDYDINAPRTLKKKDGQYFSLYGAYPRQGGYELRPGYEGVACSKDGLAWQRAKDEPILSVHQKDCGTWEKDCIYQPWLVEHRGKYYNFYNAANGNIEQMGLALSDDLLEWKRYEHNPVIPHGPEGSYNEKFSSDGKVFWDKDHWVNFFFGVGAGGAHIMAAYSRDLHHWTVNPEPLYKAGGNPSGLDKRYAHKISLVWNPSNETYYMFYNAVGAKGRGIGLITSKPLVKQQ